MDPGSLDERALGSLEGRWIGFASRDEHPNGGHGELTLVESPARFRHLFESPPIRTCSLAVPHATVNLVASQEAAEKVSITLEQPTPVDLGQPAQPLRLEELYSSMELGKVLLDEGIRELGERLRPKLLDHRARPLTVARLSNMCSR